MDSAGGASGLLSVIPFGMVFQRSYAGVCNRNGAVRLVRMQSLVVYALHGFSVCRLWTRVVVYVGLLSLLAW